MTLVMPERLRNERPALAAANASVAERIYPLPVAPASEILSEAKDQSAEDVQGDWWS
jgi:hypothetical protein